MAQTTLTDQPSVITLSDDSVNEIEQATSDLNANQLPKHGMGRAKDILPFLPFSKTTLFEWSKDGRFPAGKKLSPTMTVWSYAEVHEWLNSHTSTTSEV